MTLPIDTLIKGYTREEAFEVALTTLEAVSIPARSWRDGGVAKAIVGGVATVGSICSNIVATAIKGNFVDWAEKGWLTLFSKRMYNVDRVTATFAAGQVTLTNQGGGVYSFGADECIVVCTRTGARYRVTQGFSLAAFAQVTVDVSAIEAGSGSSAAIGEINKLETAMSRVVVGNAQPVVGTDEESDEALRSRDIAKPATRSANGPRNAYEYAALSAKLPDGTPTSINRCVVLPTAGDGTVTVVVATPSGAPTAPELKAVRDSIEDLARTDTDTVFVTAAVEVTYTRQITIWRRGSDDDTVRQNAQAALAALQTNYPIGGIKKGSGQSGFLWADGLESAVIASSPGFVFDVDQDAGDIPLAYNAVPVLAATILVRSGS